MTLIVATHTDTGVWMGGDRTSSGAAGQYTPMVAGKIHQVTTEQGFTFLLGFAGSARCAQAILRLEPPARSDDQLHEWMTRWADTVHDRCRDLGLIRDPGDEDEPYLAGYTGMIVATDRRVFYVGDNLHWTEPASGWVATGAASEVFAGAYEVLREHHDPVTAARYAWPFAQRHYRIGDLVDELTLEAS